MNQKIINTARAIISHYPQVIPLLSQKAVDIYIKHLPGQHDQSTHGHSGYSNAKPITNISGADIQARYGASGEDLSLKAIYAMQGYDGLPKEVSIEEYNNMLMNDELIRTYRGFSGGDGQYIEDYKNGEYFAGKGVSGNGTYATLSQGEARSYADNSNNVMEIGLRSDAKTISFYDVYELQRFVGNNDAVGISQIISKVSAKNESFGQQIKEALSDNNFINVINNNKNSLDLGHLAAVLGFDAITKDKHVVILNRTATVVYKGTIEEHEQSLGG